MQRSYSPTVRRRRLAAELRRLREAAGMTSLQAGKALGWAHSTIIKHEKAQRRSISPADLDALLDLYNVQDQERRNGLHALARDAKQRGWWSKYRDVFRGALPDFEAEASLIRDFEVQVIPGLLQTPEYAAAVFRSAQVQDEDTVARLVDARIQRQQILNRHQEPPTYVVVIDEGALRRQVGTPAVMHAQLRYLIRMATRDNIEILVLPFSAGAHAATAATFVILDFPDPADPSIAYSETITDTVIAEEPDELRRYNVVFGSVQNAALSPSCSVEFITELMKAQESDRV
ncbi:helix-turn-helix domain-containing protein [Marinactinospora rubrisoli]|uniref:Helix-turn-helix domain-containing protein n=1 Tax=Marinactinospora rubrisoli TaxID=2715399 RepID=A0ABW2KML7_9ACTN